MTTCAEVLSALADLGFPRAELDAAIRIESVWNPAAVNPATHAVGLIQFMPSTLRALGFPGTWQDFAKLGALEQIPWIRAYLSRWKWRVPGDTYLALAYPAALGEPDDKIIAVEGDGSLIWEQNPLWRSPGGGPVTAGSIRALLLNRMSSAKACPSSPEVDVTPPTLVRRKGAVAATLGIFTILAAAGYGAYKMLSRPPIEPRRRPVPYRPPRPVRPPERALRPPRRPLPVRPARPAYRVPRPL
jgi:hypothetical protein